MTLYMSRAELVMWFWLQFALHVAIQIAIWDNCIYNGRQSCVFAICFLLLLESVSWIKPQVYLLAIPSFKFWSMNMLELSYLPKLCHLNLLLEASISIWTSRNFWIKGSILKISTTEQLRGLFTIYKRTTYLVINDVVMMEQNGVVIEITNKCDVQQHFLFCKWVMWRRCAIHPWHVTADLVFDLIFLQFQLYYF